MPCILFPVVMIIVPVNAMECGGSLGDGRGLASHDRSETFIMVAGALAGTEDKEKRS